MTNESKYLQAVKVTFRDFAKQIRALEEDEAYAKNVLGLIQQAIEFEKKSREAHQLGARFNVIPNQVKALYDKCEHEFGLDRELAAHELEKAHNVADTDELIVYVYLFNARAENNIRAWTNLVTPLAIKDYSVNRPIYDNQYYIDELIRNKPSPEMHAYLEVIIKKSDVIFAEGARAKDNLGNPLLRVKEHTIVFDRICYFHYLGKKYKLSDGANLKFIEAE